MRKSLLFSSSFVVLFACGGGDSKTAVSTSSSGGQAASVPANAVDVPSEWRGETFKAEACDGDKGTITLTSTALTFYESCYSSNVESINNIKVVPGDGKVDVVAGIYTDPIWETAYNCSGAIEKLGDKTTFNLICKDKDGETKNIALKGQKEKPASDATAPSEMGKSGPPTAGSKGGEDADWGMDELDDEWAELGDEFEEAMEEAAEELEAAFEELGNALEGLEW